MLLLALSFLIVTDEIPRELSGLHNVCRVSEGLYSGSSPATLQAFAALRKLGVKTVISVDGARPAVELARQHGLRYVHLPVGYDGIPRETILKLVKAVQTLPGPVYLHCHHGKHRGPAAAAITQFCLDPSCGVEQAVKLMEHAGTSPLYKGLMELPHNTSRPSEAELAAIPTAFPEVAPVPALAEAMVKIDATWDRIKLLEKTSWKAPPDHADLDPAHEALQLLEHYREAARLPATARRGANFLTALDAARRSSEELEKSLRLKPDHEQRLERVRNAMLTAGRQCTTCHREHRDNPPR